MTRRNRAGLLAAGVVTFLTLIYLSIGSRSAATPGVFSNTADYSRDRVDATNGRFVDSDVAQFALPASVLEGGAIAPKLENATIKQELGRASWRLFHTMMARFPEKPTPDDSLALRTYVQLFARLYPCGDCASHFQKLLQRYPPQTSSRNAAAGWACFVHNEVNARLHKDIFDCATIGDFYDCGCGDESKDDIKVAVASETSDADTVIKPKKKE